MSKHPSISHSGRLLLDIVSYGRRGPNERIHLSATDRELIKRTVIGVPEVMLKFTGGGRSSAQVRQHLSYISRGGKIAMLADDLELLTGKEAAAQVIADWDLDIDAAPGRPLFAGAPDRRPAKLVYQATFSMPAQTDAKRLFAAVRRFARVQFETRHRYLMALHTDKSHPHVHLVVKARSEQGVRLRISKATLRDWRSQFASLLREQGIPANATDRFVRGVEAPRKRDGIYRAMQRGTSTHWRERVQRVAHELRSGALAVEPGKVKLTATRKAVMHGWQSIIEQLEVEGEREFAREVAQFAQRMERAHSEKEHIALHLLERTWRRSHAARATPVRQR